ncbi:MAG: hypothetical protein WKF83_11640 [Nocardioidaceae bacterium]
MTGRTQRWRRRCRRSIRQLRPDVDTVLYDGGQGRYPLLLAVE